MATATACPGVETERVRSRGLRQASESTERAEIPARSTATFTVTVDDLTDALELSSDGFPRLHGGEVLQVRESGEGENGQEGRLPEGVSSFILSG
jgi:hypothetical protein